MILRRVEREPSLSYRQNLQIFEDSAETTIVKSYLLIAAFLFTFSAWAETDLELLGFAKGVQVTEQELSDAYSRLEADYYGKGKDAKARNRFLRVTQAYGRLLKKQVQLHPENAAEMLKRISGEEGILELIQKCGNPNHLDCHTLWNALESRADHSLATRGLMLKWATDPTQPELRKNALKFIARKGWSNREELLAIARYANESLANKEIIQSRSLQALISNCLEGLKKGGCDANISRAILSYRGSHEEKWLEPVFQMLKEGVPDSAYRAVPLYLVQNSQLPVSTRTQIMEDLLANAPIAFATETEREVTDEAVRFVLAHGDSPKNAFRFVEAATARSKYYVDMMLDRFSPELETAIRKDLFNGRTDSASLLRHIAQIQPSNPLLGRIRSAEDEAIRKAIQEILAGCGGAHGYFSKLVRKE